MLQRCPADENVIFHDTDSIIDTSFDTQKSSEVVYLKPSELSRLPGAHFGHEPLPARKLDPGMGVAVARRTVFRPEDEKCFGRVGDRVAAGSMTLLGRPLTKTDKIEQKRLRNAIATGALLTSGRHLQHGDANQSTRNMEVFTNCSTAIATFIKFYLLLNGSGVGRSYDDSLCVVDWHQAPFLKLYISPDHADYPHTAAARIQFGCDLGVLGFNVGPDADVIMRQYLDENLEPDLSAMSEPDTIYHLIGDSREGWAKALETLEAMAFRGESDKTLLLDFSDVRKAGSPIGGMQDRPASGPISLMRAFINLKNHVMLSPRAMPLWEQNLRADHYYSVEVQVGGARRAARMATKSWRDPDILDFVRIKSEGGLWTANHSVMVDNEFWALVQAEVTDNPLSRHAHEVFDETTRCMYINGEPGFINADALEDTRTGVAREKPIYENGEDFQSDRYNVDAATGLLAELSRRSAVTRYPVTTNPCVTADTWVHTSNGPRQVGALIDLPFTAIVDGRSYSATGFWKTGTKTVFKLKTHRGYEVRATGNHQFLTVSNTNRSGVETEWKQLADIVPGDRIVLSNHRELQINTDRDEEFQHGWLLGQMVGDGGYAQPTDTDKHNTYVRFWGDQKLGQAEYAFSAVQSLPCDTHERQIACIPDINTYTDTITIASKRLTALAVGMVDAQKTILPGLEMASTSFVRGFLSGFFDADGTVAFNPTKGSSVRLSQSNLPRLQAVQRMLSRLGIASTLYDERRPAGYRNLPNGMGGYTHYLCNADHELAITRDNMDRFQEVVGFLDRDKSAKLRGVVESRVRTAYRDTFTTTVTAIDVDGFEDVYDCTVAGVHRFDANGIVAHNCGEIVLHVTGGYCVISDFAPLLSCPVPFDTILPGIVPDDISALWDARVEDSVRLGVRLLLRTNTMRALYGKEIARTNRIGIGPTGLHEYAWMRYGYDFNDLIDPTISAPFWEMLEHLSAAAKDESDRYADALGVIRPVTVTTVKPAGTTSKLFGLTEGAHLPARRQYLRWVQFKGVRDPETQAWDNASDPLLKEYEGNGYPIRSLKTFQGMSIVGFPTVPQFFNLGIGDRCVLASEATPEQQYQWLRLLEKHWIGAERGNQVSYTLKVYTSIFDLERFQAIVRENQPTIRCCAVMPSKPDAELGYEYLPEEEVPMNTFIDLVSKIKDASLHQDIDLVHLQCASGACPI